MLSVALTRPVPTLDSPPEESHGPPAGTVPTRHQCQGLIVVAIERAEPMRGKKAALTWITQCGSDLMNTESCSMNT